MPKTRRKQKAGSNNNINDIQEYNVIHRKLFNKTRDPSVFNSDNLYYIYHDLLPSMLYENDFDGVIKVLEHFDIDFLEAGEWDVVDEDIVLDNLLYLACTKEKDPLIIYFLEQLEKRSINPYRYVEEWCIEKWLRYKQKQRIENKKKAFYLRQKLPNNIALRTIPHYLQNNLFSEENIRNLTRRRRTRV